MHDPPRVMAGRARPARYSSGLQLNGTPRKRTSSAAEVDHDDSDDRCKCGWTRPGRTDVPAAQAGGRAAAGGFYREVRIPNLPKGLHLGGAFGPDLPPARAR